MAGMKTRLVFYSDSATFGGHERMTAQIIETLRNCGDYDLLLLYHHRGFEDAAPGVARTRLPFRTATPLPGLRNLNPLHIRQARRRIAAFDPDLVVVSQGNIELGLKGVLAARPLRAGVVTYIPLAFTFREMGSRFGALRDVLNRLYYRLPDAFIIEADYQARLLRRQTSAPVHVVPYPVPEAAETVRTALPAKPGDEIAVGLVGRIYFRHKNHDVLVPVARLLRDADPSFTFHIIGDGPDRARLEALIRDAGLEERLRFHGWVPRERLRRFLEDRIDIVLIPSWHEGIPLVLLEAAAFGKPFLISALPFVAEYEIPEAYLLNPGDPEAIARKLARFGAEFDADVCEATRRRILARHAPDEVHRRTRAIFRALVEKP